MGELLHVAAVRILGEVTIGGGARRLSVAGSILRRRQMRERILAKRSRERRSDRTLERSAGTLRATQIEELDPSQRVRRQRRVRVVRAALEHALQDGNRAFEIAALSR